MITPTVGRIVWYRPSDFDRVSMTVHEGGQPLAALVAFVWSDSLVNLTVSDHNGATHQRTSVHLRQDGDEGVYAGFAEWMPYQKGQAAKTEQLEKKHATAG